MSSVMSLSEGGVGTLFADSTFDNCSLKCEAPLGKGDIVYF